MLTLLTKDGTKTGNAIIYGGDDGFTLRTIRTILGEISEPKPRFFVETDFGNRMILTWSEIEEWFTIGRVQDYSEWKASQAKCREENHIKDIKYDN